MMTAASVASGMNLKVADSRLRASNTRIPAHRQSKKKFEVRHKIRKEKVGCFRKKRNYFNYRFKNTL